MSDEDREKFARRRVLVAVLVAAGGSAALAFAWLVSGACPLQGQPVLYAGGIMLMLTPVVWLGFFLVLLPSSVAAFKPDGEGFTSGGLVLFALLPLGCLVLTPFVKEVASQCRDAMNLQAGAFRAQQDRARVMEVFRLGGDLRQFKGQSGGAEDELRTIFSKLDSSQLHLLTPIYIDQPRLMPDMAYYCTNPQDLRLIAERYKNAIGDGNILSNVARNPHTPPDVLLAMGTVNYHYISLDNPNFPAAERVRILQDFAGGDVKTRLVAARDSYATPKILTALASDADVAVRQLVAENPSTPPSVLKILAKDKDVQVSWRASHALETKGNLPSPR